LQSPLVGSICWFGGAACFAEIGHRVLCVDNDEDKVNKLNQGLVPIHEEFLPEFCWDGTGARRGAVTTDLGMPRRHHK